MLASLSINNIVLIESLTIDFRRGLSVLTGETGAGKSILLDSLSLALGARGDGGLVRADATQGGVTAVFEISKDHPIRAFLEENAISENDDVILRRTQSADGRTKAFVNDTAVSAGLMKQVGEFLVEIHGQHDDRAMLDPKTHRQLLDSYGCLEPELEMVSSAWHELAKARKQLLILQAQIDEAMREADYLRTSSDELTKLAAEPGEETNLADKRQRMMKSEQIATDISDAVDLVSGNASPIPSLAGLAKRLERKCDQVPGLLNESVQHLDAALEALYSVQSSLEGALRETDFDPKDLEQSEERLFALRAASRKYSVPVEALPDLAVQMTDKVAAIDEGGERLSALKKQVEEREAVYLKHAQTLSRKRKLVAEDLASAVMSELPALKLEQAEFLVELSSDDSNAGPNGLEIIEFWVRTNPGTKAGPMVKVASGGELSRFMLALKVSLAEKGSAPTLVFDEIDTGVGGAVADAIGERLERLSNKVQVLSVTHAPQVAARAKGHFLISKRANGDASRVSTGVVEIENSDRLEEIARMLAGAKITDEARAAAGQLLK